MSTQAEKNEEERLQSLHFRQRQALNSAYGALLGEQNTQTFFAFTFEDAVDLQIERIEGDSGGQLRPNQLERVERVKQELLQAVELLKKVPPELFQDRDADKDVNTDPNQA